MTSKKTTRLEVPVEAIPLPPEALTDELDNAAPVPSEQTNEPEVAHLDFVSPEGDRICDVPLQHAFRLDGKTISSVRVRRLTVAEVGRIVRNMSKPGWDRYEIYSAQTGLPAPVLRGLLDDDGDKVTEKCADFFPHFFRTDSE